MPVSQPFVVAPFLQIVLAWNKGVSYGLFPQDSLIGQYLLIVLSILACMFLWLWLARNDSPPTAAALGLIIGGAVGNVLDRIMYDAVADFFLFHAFGYSWYVFNVADIAIVVGVAVLLYEVVSQRSALRLTGQAFAALDGQENGRGISVHLDIGVMTRSWKTVAAFAFCLIASACSETRFLDTMGLGKHAPDESRVQRNSSLALPPDLQLRTPSNAPASETQTTSTTVSSLPQPLSAPAGDVTGSLDATVGEPNAQAQPPVNPAAVPDVVAATPPAVKPAVAGNPRDNAFLKYGISKTHPDGKPKTEQQLNKELLAAIKEEKRRQDPSYGTIFNVGDLFESN